MRKCILTEFSKLCTLTCSHIQRHQSNSRQVFWVCTTQKVGSVKGDEGKYLSLATVIDYNPKTFSVVIMGHNMTITAKIAIGGGAFSESKKSSRETGGDTSLAHLREYKNPTLCWQSRRPCFSTYLLIRRVAKRGCHTFLCNDERAVSKK